MNAPTRLAALTCLAAGAASPASALSADDIKAIVAQPTAQAQSETTGPEAECFPMNLLPDCAPAPMSLRIYWENDGAQPDPFDGYDRGYTNGIALTLDHQPAWADDLAEHMPFAQAFTEAHGPAQTAAGYVLGQQIFTPRNIETRAPIPGDRPYAGYLYGGVYWQRQAAYRGRDDAAVFDHFELNLGVVGDSSLAEDVQDYVHETFNSRIPRGWDNQLKDEFAYQFYYRRKWRFDSGEFSLPLLGDLETQIIPHVGIALGSVHRYAEAGLTARVGFHLPDDFGSGRINDLKSATASDDDPGALPQGWAWYAWGRVGARYVEHNTFLDGSNTRNPSPSIDKEPFLLEAQIGLALSYHDGPYSVDLTWGVTFVSNQMDPPTGSNADEGTTSYGTVTLSLTKRF